MGLYPDYVEVMWRMLQMEKADDYVIAVGESHSIKDFLGAIFSYLNMDRQDHVEIDSHYFRLTDVDYLLGDASKPERN